MNPCCLSFFGSLFCFAALYPQIIFFFIKVMGRILEKPLVVGKYLILSSYRCDIMAKLYRYILYWYHGAPICIISSINSMIFLICWIVLLYLLTSLLFGGREILKRKKLMLSLPSSFKVQFLNFCEMYRFKLSILLFYFYIPFLQFDISLINISEELVDCIDSPEFLGSNGLWGAMS